MNPVAMTIINPRKEYWPNGDQTSNATDQAMGLSNYLKREPVSEMQFLSPFPQLSLGVYRSVFVGQSVCLSLCLLVCSIFVLTISQKLSGQFQRNLIEILTSKQRRGHIILCILEFAIHAVQMSQMEHSVEQRLHWTFCAVWY